MEPITTAVAINAVVLYLAKKLADNKGISSFFNDFADASVAWIRPIFLTDEGKEKEVIQDLIADPNEQLNKDAVTTAIAKAVKKNPDAEQLLHEMAKIIQQKEPKLVKQNTVTVNGDNNTVFQDVSNSQITSNSKNVVTGNIQAGGDVTVGDRNITQHHSGSGDNVGGNKIINQKADKIYNIDHIDKANFE